MKRLLALLAIAAAPATGQPADVDFTRDVRPILSDACFPCHGPDARTRKADLRLDTQEAALAGKDGRPPIKPGNLTESEVWTRIISTEPDEVMPPPRASKQLTTKQKETIQRWIEQGAKYQSHWSFEPIRRPSVPVVAGVRSPVDAFIINRLQKAGLTPRPEASRESLIRRVAFTLTGLPPTVDEVDRFLSDQSAGAYERMVDRYLESPRYGEEMARHWLDVARYADTHGLHLDNERQVWGYRDWVVSAYNRNLPFDRFTIEQLAGDLLPNPTPEQLAATGFNRCNVTTGEGGSIEAEWAYRNAVDRAATAAQAWLGLTAGCAVCHDHKFDPLSAREFYSLYAFFANPADPSLDGNVSVVGPMVRLPTPAQQAALDTATTAEVASRKRLEEAARAVDYSDPADASGATEPRRVTDILFDDIFPLGSTTRNTTRNAADWLADPPFGAKSGRRVLRQANSYFHEDTIQFRLRPVIVPESGTVEAWVRLDPTHRPGAVAIHTGGKKAWWGQEAGAGSNLAGSDRKGPLPQPGTWVLLSVPIADLGLTPGRPLGSLTLQEYGGIAYWDAISVTGTSAPSTDPLASFKAWRKTLGKKAPTDLPAELASLVARGHAAVLQPKDRAKLLAHYLAYVARPVGDSLATRRAEWEKARADRETADAAIPSTMVFRNASTPRDAFVMSRGQYDKPGEKVLPGVPAVLPPLKSARPGTRPTRLDLANWLVAPENPLTARVAVNRVWQQLFGAGLVRTGTDFGSQGELPTHPELLDWLADEYRASGWDTKRLVRLLVTSDVFRRDAGQSTADRAKDLDNLLFSRGPRFRLDAEQVRDNVLAVSGLIDLTAGGRGVRPYQPPNIWEPVGYADSNTRYYLQDHGAALYRRSLYVFIKRTAPHPFLANFDAPNREQLCGNRGRTNTPLQALQLMNDVQHFEAARALAERTIAATKPAEDRVGFLYRTVLARRPDPEEVRIVLQLLATQRDLYRADPAAAKAVVDTGESRPRRIAPDDETAAWTMVANLILNLDEAVTRN